MARYPGAVWLGANQADYSTYRIAPVRTVIHIEQGTESGTAAWFENPHSYVSAHFGNPKVGRLQQFVDTSQMAYHCAQFNSTSIGIENEGYAGQELNANQLNNLRCLFLWLKRVNGIPLVYTGNPSVPGIIGHGKLPEGYWSHPECPGEPVLVQVNRLIHQMNRSRADIRVKFA